VIISHERRFVILAPWKTASMTIWARLGYLDQSPYHPFYDLNPILGRVVHRHLTYADFAALPESRLDYFTAVFVRNPYDRVYSGFREAQRSLETHPRAPYPSETVRRLAMGWLTESFAGLAMAGYDFDRWVAALDEAVVAQVGRNPAVPLHPAHYWTHDNGRQAVDFIGRVENFEEDFSRLCAAIGVEHYERVNDNVSDGRLQTTDDPRGYRHLDRMNLASRQRIEALFARDFELFGYPLAEPPGREPSPTG
jgi:Sulfotransferase family